MYRGRRARSHAAMLALWTATLLGLAQAARALPADAPHAALVTHYPPQYSTSNQAAGAGPPPSSNEVHAPGPAPAPAPPVNERFPSAVLYGPTCGGTIISENWVLTAAHCTLFTSGRYILAGTNNTRDGSGIRVKVKNHYIHPLFSVGPYWMDARKYGFNQIAARYDFLLVELDKPLPLDGVKVAAASLGYGVPPPGLPVGYAGYGAEHHGETMRHDMHGMLLSTLKDSACAAQLVQFNAEDMLCARGRPPNYDAACNGDSGSGLVTETGALVGVASWVENDAFECRNGNIVVFSRLTTALPWIQQITKIPITLASPEKNQPPNAPTKTTTKNKCALSNV